MRSRPQLRRPIEACRSEILPAPPERRCTRLRCQFRWGFPRILPFPAGQKRFLEQAGLQESKLKTAIPIFFSSLPVFYQFMLTFHNFCAIVQIQFGIFPLIPALIGGMTILRAKQLQKTLFDSFHIFIVEHS